jgi:hypothetical protein
MLLYSGSIYKSVEGFVSKNKARLEIPNCVAVARSERAGHRAGTCRSSDPIAIAARAKGEDEQQFPSRSKPCHKSPVLNLVKEAVVFSHLSPSKMMATAKGGAAGCRVVHLAQRRQPTTAMWRMENTPVDSSVKVSSTDVPEMIRDFISLG